MNVYEKRCQHLMKMINAFIHEVENDYFIPQMLKHKKSAAFIPERLNELFEESIEEEFQSYSDIINKDLEIIVDDNRRRKACLQQDRHTNKRAVRKAQLVNDQVKSELSTEQEKLNRFKQVGKSNLAKFDTSIRNIDNFSQSTSKELPKWKITAQKLESLCISNRVLLNEMVQNQKDQLQNAFNKIKEQIEQFNKEMASIKSISKPKLFLTLKQYQIENESLCKSMTDILDMFNASIDDNPESHVSDYIIQLYKPFTIGEKRIRPKSIIKGLNQYYDEIEGKIQDQIRNSKIQEEQIIREIDQLERPIVYSPRNLRMIYASRRQAKSSNTSYMTEYSTRLNKSVS